MCSSLPPPPPHKFGCNVHVGVALQLPEPEPLEDPPGLHVVVGDKERHPQAHGVSSLALRRHAKIFWGEHLRTNVPLRSVVGALLCVAFLIMWAVRTEPLLGGGPRIHVSQVGMGASSASLVQYLLEHHGGERRRALVLKEVWLEELQAVGPCEEGKARAIQPPAM